MPRSFAVQLRVQGTDGSSVLVEGFERAWRTAGFWPGATVARDGMRRGPGQHTKADIAAARDAIDRWCEAANAALREGEKARAA
jgi:hypothetical protein